MHISTLVILFRLSFAYGQLNDLAKAAGLKYFGSAISYGNLSDPDYVQLASNTHDFGQITPDVAQKWWPVEVIQNQFDFSEADNVTAFAETNGQMMRCHNLVWNLYLPDWVTQGQWANESLTEALRTHITTEVTHFKGKCYAWDVVNEAVADDGTGNIKESVWTDYIGDQYVQIAFEAAAAADPSAKLYYNDYDISSPGPKLDGAVRLVKSLQAAGIKIDGVGLQSHFAVGQTPSMEVQIQSMEAFTALGVEVAITELDVLANLPLTAAESQQQMQDYATTAAACVAVKDCVGITVWGFDDRDSWLTVPGSSTGAADLFDANLNRKPAYYGVVAGLTGSSATGTTANSSSQIQLPSGTTASSSNPNTSPIPLSSNVVLVGSPFISNAAPTTFSTRVSPTPGKSKGHQNHHHASQTPSPTASTTANNLTVTTGQSQSQHLDDDDDDTPCPTATPTTSNLTMATGQSQSQNLDDDDTSFSTATPTANNLATPTGKSRPQKPNHALESPSPTAIDHSKVTGKSQSQSHSSTPGSPSAITDEIVQGLVKALGKGRAQSLGQALETSSRNANDILADIIAALGNIQR